MDEHRGLVIDGHNDLAWALRALRGSRVGGLDDPEPVAGLCTDMPRLRRGNVGGQFWSVWVDPALTGAEQVTATLEQIDVVQRLVAAYPDYLSWAPTAAKMRQAMAAGRIGSLIGVEGGDQFNGSLAVLRQYARLGARYLTLTWSRTTPWADSATDEPRHGGLTPFGREVIRELNRIGMLVDLAHVSEDTMRDALDVSTRPVIVSHSSAKALCAHPRNVPDDVLARIGASGGVIMVTFVPSFLTTARWEWGHAAGIAPLVNVATVADHVEHVRDVAGVHAVGLGGDYDGAGTMPDGMTDVSGYPALMQELARRGWSDADLEALGHRNILRVLETVDADYLSFLAGTAGEPSNVRPVVDVDQRQRTPEKVLVIQNAKASGPRRLTSWLREAGVTPDVMLAEVGLPESLDGYAGLVMLGGGFMPDDDRLCQERKLAEQAIAADLPTLGICLGGQILAQVSGGQVQAETGPAERGATLIATTEPGRNDAVLSALGASAPMIENHQDMIVRLPPDAVLLASSDAVENQAFRVGAHVRGLQFHPEICADDLLSWEESAVTCTDGSSLADLVAAARAVDADNTVSSRALIAAFAAEVIQVAQDRANQV